GGGDMAGMLCPQKAVASRLTTMFNLSRMKSLSHKKSRDHRKALFQLPDGGKFGATPTKPDYIRLPKAGQICPYSSLNRSKLNRLILPTAESPTPPVKSIVVPNSAGNKRGVRL